MNDYSKMMEADRRLVVLRILAEVPGYELNSSVLQLALQGFGHNVSRDLIHTDIAWLSEQGLVSHREIASVQVAMLTARGLDVSQGRATVPGVKRPGPGGA